VYRLAPFPARVGRAHHGNLQLRSKPGSYAAIVQLVQPSIFLTVHLYLVGWLESRY